MDVLAITIPRDDASRDCLKETGHLPCSRSSFRVSQKSFLRHDRYGIPRSAGDCGEDLIPNRGLVLLLQKRNESVFDLEYAITYVGSSTGTMDGKNTNIISSQTPNSECSA